MPPLAAIWGYALFFFALALPVTGIVFAFASVEGARSLTVGRWFQAAGLVVMSAVLVVVVRSEDTYLNNGTTVWDFHSGAHWVTIAAVCLGVAVGAVLIVARRKSITTVALGASAAVAVLQFAALIANGGD